MIVDAEYQTPIVRIIDLETDPKNEIIYRCGYCGNVVQADGAEFDSRTRLAKIETLERHKNKEQVVHGACCPNPDL